MLDVLTAENQQLRSNGDLHEEGKYYASMVRKFRTEYKSKNLHGVCKEQKVNYTKMLHCLRNDSYRKPSAKPVSL